MAQFAILCVGNLGSYPQKKRAERLNLSIYPFSGFLSMLNISVLMDTGAPLLKSAAWC
jgi:hypothetical protein